MNTVYTFLVKSFTSESGCKFTVRRGDSPTKLLFHFPLISFYLRFVEHSLNELLVR